MKTFPSRCLLFAVSLLLGCFEAVGEAQTYDPITGFSTSLNSQSSTWSYRYKDDPGRDGNYPLMSFGSFGTGTWSPVNPLVWTAAGDVPAIGVNQTGSDLLFLSGPQFTWPAGTMLMHPGFNQLAVLSWLSPVSGHINLQFSFSDLDPYGFDGVHWFVERNNSAQTLSSGTVPEGGASGLVTLLDVAVSPGDRINFIVDPNGDYAFDSTRLTATITLVPEPSSALLVACAMMFVRFRRIGATPRLPGPIRPKQC